MTTHYERPSVQRLGSLRELTEFGLAPEALFGLGRGNGRGRGRGKRNDWGSSDDGSRGSS